MRRWVPVLVPDSKGPLFLAIAAGVIRDICGARLTPGTQLPSSRVWAKQLGVHRNTVLAAVAELVAQGWLVTSPARGTFVAQTMPEHAVSKRGKALAPMGFSLPPEPPFLSPHPARPSTTFNLSTGAPDPRLVPVEVISRAWRRAVRRHGRALLEYGDPAGHVGLRRAIAQMLASLRGVPATSDNVVITRGSQMALDLLARSLLKPGDVVAVEAFGYRPAWDALRLAGAELHPILVDEKGLDVEGLQRLLRQTPVRAVYVTPHHQYPTTVTLSPERRQQLLALAQRHRFVIIEDDYDHEFHYDGRPVLPLASSDEAGVVASLGTLSKVLAPGLRLGFVVAPTALAERLSRLRAVMDRQGDHPMEAAIAELLEEGELQRHVLKMRKVYQARRDFMVSQLEQHLGEWLSWNVPAGGIALWAKTRNSVDLPGWLSRATQRGLTVRAGAQYAFDGREPGAMRLVFSRLNDREIANSINILTESLQD